MKTLRERNKELLQENEDLLQQLNKAKREREDFMMKFYKLLPKVEGLIEINVMLQDGLTKLQEEFDILESEMDEMERDKPSLSDIEQYEQKVGIIP